MRLLDSYGINGRADLFTFITYRNKASRATFFHCSISGFVPTAGIFVFQSKSSHSYLHKFITTYLTIRTHRDCQTPRANNRTILVQQNKKKSQRIICNTFTFKLSGCREKLGCETHQFLFLWNVSSSQMFIIAITWHDCLLVVFLFVFFHEI